MLPEKPYDPYSDSYYENVETGDAGLQEAWSDAVSENRHEEEKWNKTKELLNWLIKIL